jgi:hypothetical protein
MLDGLLARIAGRGAYRWGLGPRARVPEVAALTMVYRSPVILRKWVAHYGEQFGRHNLFVVSHGPCEEHAEIVVGCNYVVVPRDFSEDVARLKAMLLTRMSTVLLGIYSAVVVGDVDEMIVLDPRAGRSLRDHVLALPETAVVAPLGFHIMPDDDYFGGDGVSLAAPLLSQVNRVVFDAEFCKPSVLRRPAAFSLGQHGLMGDRFGVDESLALFHLKFLALNDVAAYDALAREVIDALGPQPERQTLWAQGFAGLRERAGWYASDGALPVRDPQAAAAGMYALPPRPPRSRAEPFAAVEIRKPEPFALADPWPELV